MRILAPLAVFALLLVAGAFWVGALAERLPDIAAVHFDARGAANGFTTRDACRRFMLLSTVGVPALIAAVTAALPRLLPPGMLNVPHREYWMAPARARDSVDFLSSRGIWFSCMLLTFLACVDWMVVKANEARPALFPSAEFLPVLALFFCATGLWLRGMFKRFPSPPPAM
jgi:hypothetical protein